MIYLMRHGQDDEAYIGGWSDVALIPEGVEEVYATSQWIKDNLQIKDIQCSDVKRAEQTAAIVSEYLSVPYHINTSLREQNKGDLNGVLRTSLNEEEEVIASSNSVDTVYPNGESLRDLYNRMKEYIGRIMEMSDDTLLITHRGVINMIYYILYDKPLDMDKKQFGVVTASVHELDTKRKVIKKVR